jgi:hypothetical protein
MVFGFSHMFMDDPEKAGDHGKARVYTMLRPFFTEFGVEVEDDKVGSHSIRKFSSTTARSNGISKDDKDHRGRWKNKRISDGYDDVQLDWIDARVAQVLSPGGVCNYVVVDQVCTSDWICTNVTPHVKDVYGHSLAFLLGKAVLWLTYDESHGEWMPPQMRQSIRTAYEAVRTIADDENPVCKRLVAVTGSDAQVYMEEVEAHEQDLQGGNNVPVNNVDNGGNVGGTRQLLLSLMSQVNSLRRAITEQNNTIELMRGNIANLRRTNTRLVQKISSNPLHQLQRAAAHGGIVGVNAAGRGGRNNTDRRNDNVPVSPARVH